MGPELFLSMLTQVREWIGTLSQAEAQDNQQTRAALQSVTFAATETRAYIALTRDQPAARNREKEVALAHLWERAGIDIYQINRDLAERCLLKADFWSDPQGWTLAEKDDSRIRLDELSAEARSLLLGY